jgi:hypothetical protein
MTSPRPAQRGEGKGEGNFLAANPMPPLPDPLLHKCVEEREKTKSPKKGDAPRTHEAQKTINLLGYS